MGTGATASTIDEYIAAFPPDTRKALEDMRAVINAAAPDATESISYAIPTFDMNGRHLVHFGAYAKHVGFYPGARVVAEVFEEELRPYRRGKGSVQFPLGRPLPTDLVRRMVEFRVEMNAGRASE